MKLIVDLARYPLPSTIHIFTKSLSLSLLPKAWIKWKKLVAVSLKESSSFFDKFLQALRLNLIFTSVILSSVLFVWSVPKRIFSKAFLWSWIHLLFINNQKFKQSPQKSLIFQTICRDEQETKIKQSIARTGSSPFSA